MQHAQTDYKAIVAEGTDVVLVVTCHMPGVVTTANIMQRMASCIKTLVNILCDLMHDAMGCILLAVLTTPGM